jgi:hypothetical protein
MAFGLRSSVLILPELRIPKLAAQQSNLASVQHLVTAAPEKHQQLRLSKGKRIRDRLIEFAFTQARQFPKNLLMHSIKQGQEFGLIGILLGVVIWHRVRPEEGQVLLRDQIGVLRLRTSNIAECKAVLGKREVADLPGDVADAAWRLPKPIGRWGVVQEVDCVVAGEDDLLDGQLQSAHKVPPCSPVKSEGGTSPHLPHESPFECQGSLFHSHRLPVNHPGLLNCWLRLKRDVIRCQLASDLILEERQGDIINIVAMGDSA